MPKKSEMTAVVFDGDGTGRIVSMPVPALEKGWIIIAPVASGLCGTDLHIATGDFPFGRLPVIPGHEFAGFVSAVGEGVENFAVGDWVGANPNISCGYCKMCTIGATNLCDSLAAAGISLNGSMADFVAVPQSVAIKLSPEISQLQAPLIEPLSCVLHALERSGSWESQKMIIFGAGTIGLIAALLAKAEGASEVVVIDPQELRHELAEEFGATQTAIDLTDLDGQEFDIALDASGNPGAIASAISILGKRGRLIQMGVTNPEVTVAFSPYELYAKELTFIGSNSLAEQYENASQRMLQLGPMLEKLVTGSYRLSEINQAMAAMRSGEHLKIQIRD
jgi:2-desacetyl-2-hydroxyethyl bacteriochlorophyllide A dehydrogenase